jgi:hypothetical protein
MSLKATPETLQAIKAAIGITGDPITFDIKLNANQEIVATATYYVPQEQLDALAQAFTAQNDGEVPDSDFILEERRYVYAYGWREIKAD